MSTDISMQPWLKYDVEVEQAQHIIEELNFVSHRHSINRYVSKSKKTSILTAIARFHISQPLCQVRDVSDPFLALISSGSLEKYIIKLIKGYKRGQERHRKPISPPF